MKALFFLLQWSVRKDKKGSMTSLANGKGIRVNRYLIRKPCNQEGEGNLAVSHCSLRMPLFTRYVSAHGERLG